MLFGCESNHSDLEKPKSQIFRRGGWLPSSSVLSSFRSRWHTPCARARRRTARHGLACTTTAHECKAPRETQHRGRHALLNVHTLHRHHRALLSLRMGGAEALPHSRHSKTRAPRTAGERPPQRAAAGPWPARYRDRGRVGVGARLLVAVRDAGDELLEVETRLVLRQPPGLDDALEQLAARRILLPRAAHGLKTRQPPGLDDPLKQLAAPRLLLPHAGHGWE